MCQQRELISKSEIVLSIEFVTLIMIMLSLF